MNTPTQLARSFQFTVDHESALLCHEPDDAYPEEEASPEAEQA
ncbi:MAG: hypothetical protein ABR590_11335 [Spirochaetia bacterium]